MIKDNFLILLDWWRTSVVLRDKKSKPNFNEGEIWWASIGMNVGVEIFGKGSEFARPVIVFKKFNEDAFLAIPLTSRSKEGMWYFPVVHNETTRIAILSQIRALDAKRLLSKMGTLSDDEFQKIKEQFTVLYASQKLFTPPDEAGCGGKSQ